MTVKQLERMQVELTQLSVPERLSGYVEKIGGKLVLTDGQKNVIAHLRAGKETRIEPWQRGGWISGSLTTYYAQLGGHTYYGRGYGESMSLSLRRLKKAK